jgi:ectoine hydroxylase-related dioxygenase (phytanoyl-CoA dioxygenase family)
MNFETDENIQSLKTNGYLIIKNFIKKKDIDSFNSELANLARLILRNKSIKINNKNVQIQISKYFKGIKKSLLYDRAQNLKALYSLVISKKVKNLSEQILKTKHIGIWPRPQLRIDVKNDTKNSLDWHNDYIYNKGTQHSYTFWIPTVTLSSNMGLLLMAKNSHTKNFSNKFIKKNKKKRFNFTLPNKVLKKLSISEIPTIKAGDLVLFHSKFLHSGQNNNSNMARLTILFRIQNLSKLEIK